ncbi:MAG: SDR family oxidoreductase [Segniliparus sp.]|uniref:SDR family oxidoreductase n=1 Tax=Segniliparus sp. TaxID=2804064 RepID=UPI003F3DD565
MSNLLADNPVATWFQNASSGFGVWRARRDPSYGVPLQGKRVLITGASSGIGEENACQFAKLGARVIIVARRQEELAAVAAKINAGGGEAIAISCDLSDLEAVDKLVEEVNAEFGGVDILVNNAGRSIRRHTAESLERWHDFERVMQINYFSAMRLTKGFLPGMVERGDGHIINAATWGVLADSLPKFGAYVASKAALAIAHRTLGVELHDKGVRTTALYYPLVRTPMIAPTRQYDKVPTLPLHEAGSWAVLAARTRPPRISARYAGWLHLQSAYFPRLADLVMRFWSRVG